MAMHNLHDVLVDMLKDLLHAEKQLVKALPRVAKAASHPDLKEAINEHLTATEVHVNRVEQAFRELDMEPKTKVCHGMMGIIEEGKEVLDARSNANGPTIDAALIAAAQKVEHYEITAYGTAKAFAVTLGLDRIVQLLDETLDEEKEADAKLSSLAESVINEAAAHAEESRQATGTARSSTRRSAAKSR
jgi:ferritin-like metal-binding protein YciE